MRTHASLKLIPIACVLAALVACQPTQQQAPPPAEVKTSVFVTFEGPWAIVEDPKDANSVLVLAPKNKLHDGLYVEASNDSSLGAGTYDLSVPAHGRPATGPLDSSFAQVKIDAKDLQHALGDKSERYVIRLPKPEAYVAAKRFVSRIGPKYPPDASTQQDYATYVSFRYDVASLSGFSLAGTPDSGTFNPVLLQLGTPSIRFAIEPAGPDDLADLCHTHSRSAFRDTVKFLGLTLFVDFPNDPEGCHKKDPQISSMPRAEIGFSVGLNRLAELLDGNLGSGDQVDVQEASAIPLVVRDFQLASLSIFGDRAKVLGAVVLFHATGTGCKAPILFLTATP